MAGTLILAYKEPILGVQRHLGLSGMDLAQSVDWGYLGQARRCALVQIHDHTNIVTQTILTPQSLSFEFRSSFHFNGCSSRVLPCSGSLAVFSVLQWFPATQAY
jgi:hypothetical protein